MVLDVESDFMKTLLCFAIIILSVTGVHAQVFFTGNNFQKLCSEDRTVCLMVVGGVVEEHHRVGEVERYVSWQKGEKLPKEEFLSYCLPKRASLNQLADVVVEFIKENPKDRHSGIAWLVTRPLASAFPCSR